MNKKCSPSNVLTNEERSYSHLIWRPECRDRIRLRRILSLPISDLFHQIVYFSPWSYIRFFIRIADRKNYYRS
jgi:hypothetical protein